MIKSFEEFHELNENSLKVPARINDIDDIDNYFWGRSAEWAKKIWGSNSGAAVDAKNGKWYYVTYKSKGVGEGYLHLKQVKMNKDGTYSIPN